MTDNTSAETAADFGPAPKGEATRWLTEIEAYEREYGPWMDRADKIARLYAMQEDLDRDERRFSLLWSNVQVLKPTLYSRDPKPAVTRRFRDKDVPARIASTLLERCLSTLLDRGTGSFGRAAREAVQERLIAGRAVARVRYKPTIQGDMVQDEDVPVDFVHRRDFGHTAGARTWAEVTAVWFIAYMTRDELVKRFGEEKGRTVPLDCKKAGAPNDRGAVDVFSKARVYWVWDSITRRCIWVAKGMAEPLDAVPYPLKLDGPFPCPAPLYGTTVDGTLIPVPDYKFYEDQADELNILTGRIAKLTEALRLVGFVGGSSAGDLAKALSSPEEVAIVPVEAWAMGQGGAGTIAWLPIREIAETLSRLMEAREAVKRDAYEVTGLSDILRGSTQASETAAAQQLKAQWGSVRVRESQQDVARFCAELLNLMAQVVCGHFEPERIADLGYLKGIAEAGQPAGPPPQPPQGIPPEMAAMMPPPPPGPTVGDMALELLKGPGALLHSRVDVESDSTIAPDEQAEREAVTEAVGAVGSVFEKGLPALQQMSMVSPQVAGTFAGVLGAMAGAAIRTIRHSEPIEAAMEQFIEALTQAAQQPPPPKPQEQGPPPDPLGAAKIQVEQQRTQLDAQRLHLDAATAQDDSRHRDEDRQQKQGQIMLEAMEPKTAVVQ